MCGQLRLKAAPMHIQLQQIPSKIEHGYVAPNYLEATARIVAPIKARSYAEMRLQAGQRVLDVGCGIGIDVMALARWVGSEGRAWGVDADAEMVQQARAKIAAAGITQANVERASAAELPWGNDTFDSVRCERMFQHLTHPENALAEMVRITRPGGRVVVLDTDWGSLSINALNSALERRLVAFKPEQALRNGFVGRRLPALMQHAGLNDLHIAVLPVYSTQYATARFACALDDLTERAQQAGLATSREIKDFEQSLSTLDRAGCFFASVNMVLVAGTKVSL